MATTRANRRRGVRAGGGDRLLLLRKYYEGDTFEFWRGPKPALGDTNYSEVMRQIEEQFTTSNLIQECIDRVANALIGKQPHWTVRRPRSAVVASEDEREAEASAISSASEVLQLWFNEITRQGASGEYEHADPMIKFVTDLLTYERGTLRLFSTGRVIDPEPWETVGMHAPDPASISVDFSPDDHYIERIEYKHSDFTTEVQTQDLVFIDGAGNVIDIPEDAENDQIESIIASRDDVTTSQALRIMLNTSAGGESSAEDVKLIPELAGRWTIVTACHDSLITLSARQLQDSLNVALTMLSRNIVQAGFVERIISNASLPGRWEPDPADSSKQVFIADPKREFLGGPGTTTWLQGNPIGPRNAPTGQTEPSVSYRNPVPVDTFKDTIEQYRTLMYLQFGMGFLLSAGDAGMSGTSRIELKQDFVMALQETITKIEALLSAVFTAALILMDDPESPQYDGFEVAVTLRITVGSLLPEERQAIIAEANGGFLSRRTAIAMLGHVDDVDAEIAQIETEQSEREKRSLMMQQQIAEISSGGLDDGVEPTRRMS